MVKLEVLQQPIPKPKHPTVHNGELILRPALLHSRGLDNISTLLVHIELNKLIVFLLFSAAIGYNGVQLLLVQSVDVANVSEPGVQETHVFWCHGGFDTTAAVVTADDDMLDFKVADGVVYDGHDVQVDVVDEVGDVAVDEHLAWIETGDGFGGDAGVRAACRY